MPWLNSLFGKKRQIIKPLRRVISKPQTTAIPAIPSAVPFSFPPVPQAIAQLDFVALLVEAQQGETAP